jgi:hypothetical protein
MTDLKGWKVGRDVQVKPVEVYYYQGHMMGWININIIVDGIQTTLWATGLFPPFNALLKFLIHIMERSFPSTFEMEEEGPFKVFRAEAVDEPELFRFRLTGNQEEVFLDNLFDRKQFVYAFYDDLHLFMNTSFCQEEWGEPLVSERLSSRLQGLVEQSRKG